MPTDVDAEVTLGAWDDALLDGVGLVVKSPGVPTEAAPVAAARARGVPVISEIELGARLLPNPLIGVTGTNGKTTTTALLGAVLESAALEGRGRREHRPAADVARRCRRRTTRGSSASCRRSSSRTSRRSRPRVAVLTNLEPDHLDRHGTFDAYAALKLAGLRAPGAGRRRRRSARFPAALPGDARRVEFSADDPLPAEPRIRGAHNRENAAAATAAARAIGVDDDAIGRALESFPGVEHRIEEVATVDGVLYVNDSKATNAAAALRALASFPGGGST